MPLLGYIKGGRCLQAKSGSRKSLVVVDPVLGDNGKLYANFHDSMIKEMRQLVTKADVITPNLTELFYLLDQIGRAHV